MEKMKKAVAYLRTSSASNVGADKDSDKRQRAAIEAYAKAAGYEIVDEQWDAAVSGADPLDARKGFTALLERIAGNGVRTIIVESAHRFARDLVVQETGFRHLREQGVELIAADSPTSFLDDTPTAAFIRQVLGAVAQLDKAMTVAKLKAARDRKKARNGKCEGRKSYSETRAGLVEEVRSMRRSGLTLQEIVSVLTSRGVRTDKETVFAPSQIARMLTEEDNHLGKIARDKSPRRTATEETA